MLHFKRLLLVATLSLCISLPANAGSGAAYWLSNIWTAGTITMAALGSYYSYEAREQILNHDPDYDGTASATRSLMGSTATLGISAALSTFALCAGLAGEEKAPLAGALSAAAAVVAVIPGITTAIAFGIEDNHRYGPNNEKGSSDQNLKTSMGLSWSTWAADAFGGLLFFLAARMHTNPSHQSSHV